MKKNNCFYYFIYKINKNYLFEKLHSEMGNGRVLIKIKLHFKECFHNWHYFPYSIFN